MPIDVAAVLKSAGWTDEDLKAFSPEKFKGVETLVTQAEAQREQAELAQRSWTEMFEKEITPALNDWGVKEANLAAERDYYKTLAEGAKAGGFVAEVPPFKPGEAQPRSAAGQFQPNANAVPGSPDMAAFESRVSEAVGNLSDLQWRYQTLFGKGLPDAPTALAREAAAQKMSMLDYAAKKYGFADRQKAIDDEQRKTHEDAIRKTAVEERDKFWAERTGQNPNVRQGTTSQFSQLRKGVQDGTRQDPLKMTPEQRRSATREAINKDIATMIQ